MRHIRVRVEPLKMSYIKKICKNFVMFNNGRRKNFEGKIVDPLKSICYPNFNMRLGYFVFLSLFLLPFFACLPTGRVFAGVVINEIAWMGIVGNQYGEWVELYNNSSEEIDLNSWGLYKVKDGSDILIFTLTKKISDGGYLVIERITDSSSDPLPDINDEAGKFGGGSLVNLPSGEHLILKDIAGNIVEDLDFSGGWPAGDNTTKETMQKAGSGWVTATGTPKAQNVGGSSQSQNPPPSQQPPQNQTSGGGSSQYTLLENLPKIKAYAGEDKVTAVGALVEFRGLAFGFDDKPIANTRFMWNFGDGATKEGQNVYYSYRYPGEYSAVLDIASGEYAASDRLTVKVVPAEIFISEIKPGADSFIEIYNKSKEELNISGWQISFGTQSFFFPKGTYIRPEAYLVITHSVSGIDLISGSGLVKLSYVGGFLADTFNYQGVLIEGQSFSRQDKGSIITKETPGLVNVLPQVVQSQPQPQAEIIKGTAALVQNNFSNDAVAAAEEKEAPITAEVASVNTGISPQANGWKFYFLLVLALAVLTGGGVLFIRHQRSD